MPTIHPTSIIEPGAKLAPDVQIGPFCHVGPRVTLGPGTRLVSHVSVQGRTTLGAHNTIWPFAVLGGAPQDLKYRGEDTQLIIGDHNQIRESATLQVGTANGGGVTRVGSHNLIMVAAHVAHDCTLGDRVILANAVLLAGHIRIDDHAVISGNCAITHFVSVGRYSFIGGLSAIKHDVPPFMVVDGNPARVRKVNVIGLERNGFSPEAIAHLKKALRALFRGLPQGTEGEDDSPPPEAMPAGAPVQGSLTEKLAQLESEYVGDEHIAHLVQFLRNSSNGLYGRYLETQRKDSRYRREQKA